MGFFFKNKKKNKEEETVTPVVETTPEVPAKEGMILVREGIKLGLPTVSMEEAIVAAGELLRDLGYVDDDYIPAMIRRNEEASVYMGLGLAIPHGTEDAKRDVKRSGIIVMQYPDGVEFNGGTAQLVIGIAGERCTGVTRDTFALAVSSRSKYQIISIVYCRLKSQKGG